MNCKSMHTAKQLKVNSICSWLEQYLYCNLGNLTHNLPATSTKSDLSLSGMSDVQCFSFSSQARPEVNTHVKEEILNGTHYQSIFCSASHAKPSASLHWDIHGAPPSEDIFSIINTNSTLPNGTGSIISMLRFPIHLNNESSVACVIQHPALTEPITTVIQLQTFGRLLLEC